MNHIQLAMPAGQEALAREFYGKLLGLSEITKPANLQGRGGVWFWVGERQLHLGVEADFKPAKKAHPAFTVNSRAVAREILESARFPVIHDEPLIGYSRFYSQDPFGNRLEFMESILTSGDTRNAS